MKKATLGFIIFAWFLSGQAHGQWRQWGGPARDFNVETDAEIDVWGEHGPKVLWLRALGPGYSGIVADGDRLFTMTRQEASEVIVALSAEDGTELWRHAYAAPTDRLQFVDKSYGDAPQATPLVSGGHVYGFGFTGILTAVNAQTGEGVWSQDLARELGTGTPYFGHAASPLVVGDTVVVLAGGAHAFDLRTGELRWKNRDFAASYASPILIESPAGLQVVAAAAGEVVGLSPRTAVCSGATSTPISTGRFSTRRRWGRTALSSRRPISSARSACVSRTTVHPLSSGKSPTSRSRIQTRSLWTGWWSPRTTETWSAWSWRRARSYGASVA